MRGAGKRPCHAGLPRNGRGCQVGCRPVPHDLPPWRLVYHYFSKRQKPGLWQKFNDALRDTVRAKHGKNTPTAGILDSQTVNMADRPGERSYDAGKKVVGRKRHLLVDTLGPVLVAVVHGAGIQDRDGARMVLEKALAFGWLRVFFADGGYAGQLVAWVRHLFRGQGTRLEIVSRNKPCFRVLPKRWIIERILLADSFSLPG